jgi:hypothetical protein
MIYDDSKERQTADEREAFKVPRRVVQQMTDAFAAAFGCTVTRAYCLTCDSPLDEDERVAHDDAGHRIINHHATGATPDPDGRGAEEGKR